MSESNDKKGQKTLIILISVVVFIGIVLFLILNKNKDSSGNNIKDYSKIDIKSIEYSVGGGFGTVKDISTKYILVDEEGNVKLSNSYDFYVEEYSISKDMFNELENYIKKRSSIFDGVGEGNGTDGNHSYLEIKLTDGKDYKIGGYMISDKTFSEIVDKVRLTVGDDKISQYNKNFKERPVSSNNIESFEYDDYLSNSIVAKLLISSDGKVHVDNNFDSSTMDLNFDIDKFNEINNYLDSNISMFDNSTSLEKDYESFVITVKYQDGNIKTVEGNRSVENLKKYENIMREIEEMIPDLGSKYSGYLLDLALKISDDE